MTISCQVKELWHISEKDWLNLTDCQQCLAFLHTKKYPGGASIHRIDESFPLKPTLECTVLQRGDTSITNEFLMSHSLTSMNFWIDFLHNLDLWKFQVIIMLSELVHAFWFYLLPNGLLRNWEISILSMQLSLLNVEDWHYSH